MTTFLGTTILELTENSKKNLHNTAIKWQKMGDFSPTMVDYHITLYQAKYNISDEIKMIDTYQKYIKLDDIPPILEIDWLNTKWEYCGVRLKKSHLLEALQNTVVTYSNPYRWWYIRSTYINNNAYNIDEQCMIQKFWYPFLYTAFTPHITLGTMQNNQIDTDILQHHIWFRDITIKWLSFVIKKEKTKIVIPLFSFL